MNFNSWQIVAQVLAELAALKSLRPGDAIDLPAVHVKSGTTAVTISIHVAEDLPRVKA